MRVTAARGGEESGSDPRGPPRSCFASAESTAWVLARGGQEAGLTHGCLYGQFDQKDALVAAVSPFAGQRSRRNDRKSARAGRTGRGDLGPLPLARIGDQAGEGYLLAALASDGSPARPCSAQASDGWAPSASRDPGTPCGHRPPSTPTIGRLSPDGGTSRRHRSRPGRFDDPALSDAFLTAVSPSPVTASRSSRRKSASSTDIAVRPSRMKADRRKARSRGDRHQRIPCDGTSVPSRVPLPY